VFAFLAYMFSLLTFVLAVAVALNVPLEGL
jgi:hypothetical protein